MPLALQVDLKLSQVVAGNKWSVVPSPKLEVWLLRYPRAPVDLVMLPCIEILLPKWMSCAKSLGWPRAELSVVAAEAFNSGSSSSDIMSTAYVARDVVPDAALLLLCFSCFAG